MIAKFSLSNPESAIASSKGCSVRQQWNSSKYVRPRFLRPRIRALTTLAQTNGGTHSVLVAGGGGVAIKTAMRLKEMSCDVYIMQRSSNRRQQIENMDATFVKADALDPQELESAFEGLKVDTVISSIGGSPANTEPDSEGNINLINEAIKRGAKRFVLVTSIGAGDSRDAPPKQVYEVLGPQLQAKEQAEEYLKGLESEIEYVIVRPGGLKSDSPSGTGILTKDSHVCGAIQRDDAAELIAKCALSTKASNVVLAAVDKNMLFGNPEYAVFFP